MARLPQPGGDAGSWGSVLNDFLSQAHASDGTIKAGVIDESSLSTTVQTKINAVAGPTGATGPAGPAGNVGATGASGAAGVAGASGATGVTGATGSTGIAGPAGATGAQGLAGASGATGPAGATGATGPAGATTIGGITGLQSALDAKTDKATMPIRFSAATALTGLTPSDRAYTARTLSGARMRVASAPVGSALTAQVQHFDGMSWTTIGTLTTADGSVAESTTSFTQSQIVGDLLRLNVTSIGLTTAATGVVVDVLWS